MWLGCDGFGSGPVAARLACRSALRITRCQDNRSPMPTRIQHNPSTSRFETIIDGQLCIADYALAGAMMSLHHTYVPPALEGRGIAAALVAAALAHARREGLHVRPTCSYVSAYMRRHPETLDLLAD